MRSPRWQLGVAALAGLLAAPWVRAQHPSHDQPTAASPPAATAAKRGASEAPSHRPQPRLRPMAALQHLQATATQAAATRATAAAAQPRPQRPAARPERPAGAGRYVAALVVCADADLDPGATFGMPRQDLLVLQTAGGLLDRDSIALLEHFATTERLSLVVLLGHPDCSAQQVRGSTRAQAGLAARLRLLGEGVPATAPPVAPQLRQREALLDASEVLGGLAKDDQLRVVVAQLAADGTVTWHQEAASTLPLAPVK